jgi:hypothetical protein
VPGRAGLNNGVLLGLKDKSTSILSLPFPPTIAKNISSPITKVTIPASRTANLGCKARILDFIGMFDVF